MIDFDFPKGALALLSCGRPLLRQNFKTFLLSLVLICSKVIRVENNQQLVESTSRN